ncbi:hypothetical protein AB0H73_09480 [Streptomyces olivoreticuli]
MSFLAPESAVARAVDDLLERVDSARGAADQIQTLARINSPGTVRREPGRREAVGHLAGGRVSVRVTAPDPRPADPRTPSERALGDYLLALVRAADVQVPEHRRVPRTVAAMQACIAERTAGTS